MDQDFREKIWDSFRRINVRAGHVLKMNVNR